MIYEKIIHGVNTTFSHKVYDHFTMPWHYHPEYELIVILSGGGKRFVGDYVDDFSKGDLAFFGANLPHYHMCYGLVNNIPEKVSGCEVIQFPSEIFPENMTSINELSVVGNLLERSKQGVIFTNPPNISRVQQMMNFIDRSHGIKRFIALLRILDMLGRSSEYRLITSPDYSINLTAEDENDPANRVYKYMLNHFKEEITLDKLASQAGFNASALCRYFKKRSQKSIFECLQEIRVDFARKLILNSSMPISHIAYECGYTNVSNFNRQFKKIMEMTPTEYKVLQQKGMDAETLSTEILDAVKTF